MTKIYFLDNDMSLCLLSGFINSDHAPPIMACNINRDGILRLLGLEFMIGTAEMCCLLIMVTRCLTEVPA